MIKFERFSGADNVYHSLGKGDKYKKQRSTTQVRNPI